MKPQAGRPVVDAGSNSAVPDGVTTDQRGVARVRHGTVDIGAVETGLVQSIFVSPINDRTFGDADFRVSASARSNLPVSFTAGGSVNVYQGNDVWYAHITGAGSAVITATQDGGQRSGFNQLSPFASLVPAAAGRSASPHPRSPRMVGRHHRR